MVLFDDSCISLAEALAVVRACYDVPVGEPVCSSERP
jgi:hypothetical protein